MKTPEQILEWLEERLETELEGIKECKAMKDNKSVGYGMYAGSYDTLNDLKRFINDEE